MSPVIRVISHRSLFTSDIFFINLTPILTLKLFWKVCIVMIRREIKWWWCNQPRWYIVPPAMPQAKAWWRHQMETFSALLALCAGIHQSPVNSPQKRPVTRSLIYFLWSAPWLYGRVNNRDAGDLRRHHAHYWRHCNAHVQTILACQPNSAWQSGYI